MRRMNDVWLVFETFWNVPFNSGSVLYDTLITLSKTIEWRRASNLPMAAGTSLLPNAINFSSSLIALAPDA